MTCKDPCLYCWLFEDGGWIKILLGLGFFMCAMGSGINLERIIHTCPTQCPEISAHVW